jgi:hypothetical protein
MTGAGMVHTHDLAKKFSDKDRNDKAFGLVRTGGEVHNLLIPAVGVGEILCSTD